MCKKGLKQSTLTIKRDDIRRLRMRKMSDLKLKVREIQAAINDMQGKAPQAIAWTSLFPKP